MRSKHWEPSATVLAKQVDELGKLLPLSLSIAVTYGFLHAVSGVVLQEFIFDLAECSLDCLNLSQDIDAVPALLDHSGHAAYLAFNSSEPGYNGFRRRVMHLTYTSWGYI